MRQTIAEQSQAAQETGEIRPVLETLHRLNTGGVDLMDKLAIELNRVVRAVAENDGQKASGHVAMKIKIARTKFADAVAIEVEVDTKIPKQPNGSQLLFFDEDGNLHARNPRQRDAFEEGPTSV